MKLLIITQVIDRNDPVLGFFCEWVKEFTKQCEQVTVICLRKGEHDLPENVKVLSLGKEEGVSRIKYLYRFYKYIFSERKNYDAVFIHMNQVYAILGGLCWRMMGKKIGLWYAHGRIPFSLRIANMFINTAFASTQQGYGIKTKKLQIVGQGIDVNKFIPVNSYDKYSIITVGRISPVKRIDLIISAFKKIKEKYSESKLYIVGSVGLSEHDVYLKDLNNCVKKLNLDNSVIFMGARKHDELPKILANKHVFINMSNTGSLDKAILEAMSCGVPVVSSNESFKNIVQDQRYHVNNEEELAVKIDELFSNQNRATLRDLVIKEHSLSCLSMKIFNSFKLL
jgi:glycosyltransferase involved in cell wall biosynthesis